MTNPNACRWCGIDQRPHGRQYTETASWHAWEQPTEDQIKARMLARHAERNEAPMPTTPAATAPHHLIVAYAPEGRITSWDHPDNCPDGENCDILRRTRRMGLHDMADLGEGRPAGTYLLGRFGFHGLGLIDNDGNTLPDAPTEVPQPYNTTDPTPRPEDHLAVAAHDIICEVLDALAEPLLEDADTARALLEEIRMAQVLDQDSRAARPRSVLINDFVGDPGRFTGPLIRLFEALEHPLPDVPQSTTTA